MKTMFKAFASLTLVCLLAVSVQAASPQDGSVLDGKMKSLEGKEVDLSKYEGKVLLVVNVASKCGATPQYQQLQALHNAYQDKGLAVLGFPCNQFGGQEPGTSEQIRQFCDDKYEVSFDMFDKVDVNGDNTAPIYQSLKSYTEDPGDVKWNFEKFLVGKDGKVVARYRTKTKPDAPEVIKAIEAELAK